MPLAVVRKAAALLVRPTDDGDELLVFEHPDGSLQLPKGTVEPGEATDVAVLRELREETGVDARVAEALPLVGFPADEAGERQVWHPYLLTTDRSLPDAWDHEPGGGGEEAGLVFRCRWLALPTATDHLHPIFHPLVASALSSGWAIARQWSRRAPEWDRRVGPDGDGNRIHNSDPVLWRLLGDVAGQTVLDAGCGTGYLTAKLVAAGAVVHAVDVAPGMVVLAAGRAPDAQVRTDDAMTLATVPDASCDALVSNYVWMDLPDLDAAVAATARVLKPGGRAVVVFSHPAFTSGERVDTHTLRFSRSYFARGPRTERWGPFSEAFTHFHRPLRDYVQAVLDHGLVLEALEEPVARPDADLPPEALERIRLYPYSVAIRARRPA